MLRLDHSDRKMALLVNEVVEKLLIVGISDAGTSITLMPFNCWGRNNVCTKLRSDAARDCIVVPRNWFL